MVASRRDQQSKIRTRGRDDKIGYAQTKNLRAVEKRWVISSIALRDTYVMIWMSNALILL